MEKNLIVKELNRELAMRRRVYRKVVGCEESFVDMQEQKQYRIILFLRNLLDDATDKDFKEFILKVESKSLVPNAIQPTLF